MAKNPNILVIRDGNNELIIGPRHAFVGQDEFDFIESLDEVLSMLKAVIDQPGEIDQLRTACDRWHIDDSRTTCLSDIGLKQLVAEACVSRQLGAVYLEDMSTEWQSQIVSIEKYRDQKAKRKEKDGVSGANKEKPKVPDELSERFLEVFDRMFEKEHAGEFAEKAKDVLKGDLINRTISMVMSRKFLMSGKGAKLVARLVGRSFFAVATMIWTAYSRGREIGQAIAEIVEAVEITREAKKDEDLSAAAKLMAKGLSTLGAELLDALLGKIAPSVKPVKQAKSSIHAAHGSPPNPRSSSNGNVSSRRGSERSDRDGSHAAKSDPPKSKTPDEQQRKPRNIPTEAERRKLAQNAVDQNDFATDPSKAVFYSGPGNRDRALAAAESRNAQPIDVIDGGKALAQQDLYNKHNPLYAEADQYWGKASEKYAKGASGDITAYVDGARPDRVFAQKELPILLDNPNVKTINGLDRKFLARIEEEFPGSAFRALGGGS